MTEPTDPLRETFRRYAETIRLTHRPGTMAAYRSIGEDFIRFLEVHHPEVSSFSDLTRPHIESWFRYLANVTHRRGRSLAPSTRAGHISKIRAFLEDIQAWGWPEAPPVIPIQRGDAPRTEKCLPKPLSKDSDEALRRELKSAGGLLANALLLLRYTGMRCGELLELEMDSIEKDSDGYGSIRVPAGKGYEERCIPVDRTTLEIAEEIRRLRGEHPPFPHPETGKPTRFLLLWPGGSRPDRHSMYQELQAVAKRARLTERVWPHRLRHTYATEMLRGGMNPFHLMRILGHKSLDMTLRYARVTQSDIRRSYLKAREALEARYDLPAAPAPEPEGKESSLTHAGIVRGIQTVAAQLESFRRDQEEPASKKKIQRLVERLQRVARDLEGLKL
jgi:site-specific recombinase XerD